MRITKSIIIFFFCAKLVLPQETAEQFFKLPALIEHFTAHKTKDSSISLIDFIQLHYADDTHHSVNHRDHDRLPFSHHEHTAQCAQAILLYQPASPIALQFKNITTGNVSFISPVESFYPDHTISIWQPPKIA